MMMFLLLVRVDGQHIVSSAHLMCWYFAMMYDVPSCLVDQTSPTQRLYPFFRGGYCCTIYPLPSGSGALACCVQDVLDVGVCWSVSRFAARGGSAGEKRLFL